MSWSNTQCQIVKYNLHAIVWQLPLLAHPGPANDAIHCSLLSLFIASSIINITKYLTPRSSIFDHWSFLCSTATCVQKTPKSLQSALGNSTKVTQPRLKNKMYGGWVRRYCVLGRFPMGRTLQHIYRYRRWKILLSRWLLAMTPNTFYNPNITFFYFFDMWTDTSQV